MRNAADNRAHMRLHGVLPAPDAADLEALAIDVAGDPDRDFLRGPCLDRLRFAGFIERRQDPKSGVRIIPTASGRAALAEHNGARQ